jgi:outer membrane protein assembly factor BamB
VGNNFVVQSEYALFPGQGSVDCYELSTGKLKWRAQTNAGSMPAIVAVDDERVVCSDMQAGGAKCTLSAWDLLTGKRLWTSEEVAGNLTNNFNRGWGQQTLAVVKGCGRIPMSVYDMRTRKASVLMFDGANGKLLWRSDLPLNVQAPPVTVGIKHAAAVIMQPGGGGELRVWDLDTGKLVESRSVKEAGSLVAQQDVVLLFGTAGGVERLKPGAPEPATAPDVKK